MAAKIRLSVAVLFDHELRAAAAALHKAAALPKGEEAAQAWTDAIQLAYVALDAITPDVTGLTIIHVRREVVDLASVPDPEVQDANQP